MQAEDVYSFRRNAVHDMVAFEVQAVRERVGIMDISAFAKIEVAGAGARALLDRLAANRLPAPGRIVLSHFLNRRGRIEVEATIAGLVGDRFYLTCAAFFEQRLLDHLRHNLEAEEVEIINRSTEWAALALQGPRSREVLAANTGAGLDNAAFPWMRVRQIDIAGHPAWAMRLSYAGELGWEIHAPAESLPAIYDALWASGEPHGIADYGSFAMNAMRMEKGFKGAGELTNEVTLAEADVMRFVRLDKGDFLGRDATAAGLDRPLPWICVYLDIEPDGEHDGHGGEAVLLDGQTVGATSSVAFGHSVGRILAFAYVKPDAAAPGTALEVVIMGQPRRALVLAEPAYDPAGRLPRGEV
jgi:dimethylglycine dehydrogenase